MMDQVKIVDLEPDSTEYAHVCFMFCLTLLTEEYIIKIQRVQNKPLWERYLQTKRELHKKNAGDTNEKELFHGTRDKPPQVICESAEGFDMRLSSDMACGDELTTLLLTPVTQTRMRIIMKVNRPIS